MSSFRTGDIRSATDFRNNIREHLTRLKETGRVEILTVNGEAEGVVLSPDAFQRLVDEAEYGKSVRLVRQSIEEYKKGEGIPADVVFSELRDRLGESEG